MSPIGINFTTGNPVVRSRREANVKDHGAYGDGASHPLAKEFRSLAQAQAVFPHALALTDEIDWAATQAAINTPNTREVVMPRGKYIWNRPVVGVPAMALVGEGVGTRALTSTTGTIIDATALSSGTILDCTPGGAYGTVLEDFFIEGATGGSAVVVNFSVQRGEMRRLGISRGRIGTIVQTIGCIFEGVEWDLPAYHGVEVYQLGRHRFRACTFANATSNGSANMIIYGDARDVRIEDSLFDECFGTGSNTLEIYLSREVTVRGCKMYNGPGNGILLDTAGGYPTRVTIEDFRCEPFSSNPVNTIRINGGAGHRLINVSTDPGAGGDILDSGTDTVWLNVNGRYKMPSLPTTDPGAGSKQLWCDTGDLNRVKFRT